MWILAAMTTGGCHIHQQECQPVASLIFPVLPKSISQKKGIQSNAGLLVPIVAVGKLGYPDLAEKALRDGDCDMVMLGRPLLADAQWCNKAYEGRVHEIRPCIGCQEGCVNEFVEGGHIQCTVNPRTGFEDVFPANTEPALRKKKIAVIGGGPAGMEFALTAYRRGHHVDLFEKNRSAWWKNCSGPQHQKLNSILKIIWSI